MRTFRKLFTAALVSFLLLALLTGPAFARQSVTRTKTFTAAAADAAIVTKNTPIYIHQLSWTGSGTRTTCTVKMQYSSNATSWSDLTSAQTCTSNGSVTATGFYNYVRVNLTAITGAANTLNTRYDGSGSIELSSLRGPVAAYFQYTTPTTDTAERTAVAADAAAFWNLKTAVCINAGATSTMLNILDTGSGTVLGRVPCIKSSVGSNPPVVFDPPLRATAKNKALIIAAQDASTTVYFTITGFKSPD